MDDIFVLIPGRTSAQGAGISEGKFEATYVRETTSLQMTPADMGRLQLEEGHWVELTSDYGRVKVQVIPSKKDELPDGILFIAYGDISSQLMGGDTHGSGMPTSKGLDVTVKATDPPANNADP